MSQDSNNLNAQRRQWLASALVGAGQLIYSANALAATQTNATSQTASKTWRLAVVPQLTAVEMTRNWTPIVSALAQAGLNMELVIYPSISKFEPEFLKGHADFVFLNPYHMVMAKRTQRYEPLLRDARPLEGLLVVKADGPVQAIEQLKDHRLSFPAPNAFAASLYIRSMLERKHHLAFDAHYAGTHRNAIRQVLAGDSAAAGVVRTTLEQEPPEVRQAVRVIYTTPPLSPHPLAAHPRVPASVRQQVSQVLLALADKPETTALMGAIQMPSPQAAIYAKDYAPLEQLKIEKFVVVE
ncbi:phosphate/phosphite/phosphonate ABC transporter substrate-binding protein [Rhodoferax aquaticus]|uniref:Phosphate/phosphite/phosphonate ABC transporter substrate-binding protein n=1 Tax=Rhodoferax aquaticus TaxID=2527691 RepID=A0A515EPC4_9BURK|nr:phosphate/phosphite/phosphonate ABC transporter substrate-binding protein [Rhodoferax aquaticus]QDL54480.1 phosphate/phosphite/phosphonate ABC transporter substrate-binding protein [Rhodoferax aquaticus]